MLATRDDNNLPPTKTEYEKYMGGTSQPLHFHLFHKEERKIHGVFSVR